MAAATQKNDETLLAELGYKQELKRDWSMIHNFGYVIHSCANSFVRSSVPYSVSFSIISVITGITTLFEYG